MPLPTEWLTDRLIVLNANPSDLNELEKIRLSTLYMADWCSNEGANASQSFSDYFQDGPELPPHGKKENYQLQIIRNKSNNEAVGYIGCYHGYPNEQTLWIAIFCIHEKHQKSGLGKEFVSKLKQISSSPYIELAVDLKNWPAIKFWTEQGIDKVVRYSGDRLYSPETFARVALQYRNKK